MSGGEYAYLAHEYREDQHAYYYAAGTPYDEVAMQWELRKAEEERRNQERLEAWRSRQRYVPSS